MIHSSTQTVMPNGTSTSKPANSHLRMAAIRRCPYPMCQGLQCWKRAKLMLEQRLQRCPMLRVLAQLRHLIWNPLLQRLAR